jgi:uncharacterized protein (DUF1501 family)
MLRRDFLKNSTLIALGTSVPGFLASTALAADKSATKKDTILVVVELTGGNDGLNTVIPHGDDLYHKARPTLRYTKNNVVKVDDHIGLNPGLRALEQMLGNGELAIVQGVGYPNPNRSHFESMDVWHTGDPTGKRGDGWLSRALSRFAFEGKIPAIHVGTNKLPLALQGPTSGIASVHPNRTFDLHLGGNPEQGFSRNPFQSVTRGTFAPAEKADDPEAKRRAKRRSLIQELTRDTPEAGNLLPFVQRSALQTYTTIDRLKEIMRDTRDDNRFFRNVGEDEGQLTAQLSLVAKMIRAEFGSRIFYVSIGGWDTHSEQREKHEKLLREVGSAIANFFSQLDQPTPVDEGRAVPPPVFSAPGTTGKVPAQAPKPEHSPRVVVMTYSEFGRRVQENGSRGTDHGAASCLFLAGPRVKGGLVGKHPSLATLDDGDLKFHTDFRQVYATLLDQWLGCDSRLVLGGKFEHLPLLRKEGEAPKPLKDRGPVPPPPASDD